MPVSTEGPARRLVLFKATPVKGVIAASVLEGEMSGLAVSCIIMGEALTEGGIIIMVLEGVVLFVGVLLMGFMGALPLAEQANSVDMSISSINITITFFKPSLQ